MKILSKILIFSLAGILVACNSWEDEENLRNADNNADLSELVASMPELSTFAAVLQKTGYGEFLQAQPSLTVFAPDNTALSALNLDDAEQLKLWVQDYIAALLYYVDAEGSFGVDNLRMINDKNVPSGTMKISGANIVKANIAGKNGVLHIIDATIEARKSIWEYASQQNGYTQVQFITSEFRRVMDITRSVQTGVDAIGRPVYDTVWVTQNDFLSRFPVDNERQNFTLVLLENSSFDMLKTKYAKYFYQKDAQAMEKEILRQISGDLVLRETKIIAPGRFPSAENILVDIDPANITETYQASNGMVYKVNAADIKIYQNKIKEQIIDANDYVERYPEDPWLQRYRSWAMGGNDMVLKGVTVFNYDFNRRLFDINGSDSIVYVNQSSGSFRYDGDSRTTAVNCYLKYEPTLYSTTYEFAWNAYDDVEAHKTGMRIDLGYDNDSVRIYDTIPLLLRQKLMLSFPDEPVVRRTADGYIANNFSSFTLMGATDTAGVYRETVLTRFKKAVTEENATSYFVVGAPPVPYNEADAYGQGSRLICPTYGKATFLVANTVERTSYAGMMFLNYIKIVPIIDPND
jgi:hypothetical protein